MLAGWEIATPDIPAEAWARIDAIGSTVIKLRPMTLLGPYGAQNAAEINRRGLAVAIRPDSDGDIHPFTDQVVQCAAMLSVPRLYVILDNEPNLGSRPVDPDYWPGINRLLSYLRLRVPSGVIVSPPMAVAQRDGEWMDAGADVIAGCDLVGVHCYGQQDTGLIGHSLQLAAQFGKRLFADEVGDSHPSISNRQRAASVASYLRVLAERGDVEAACIFLAYSRDPQWAIYQLPVDTLGIIRDTLAQQNAREEPMATLTIESAPAMVAGTIWPFRARVVVPPGGAILTMLGHLPLNGNNETYWQDFVVFKPVGEDGVIALDYHTPQVSGLPADGIEVNWQIDVMSPKLGAAPFASANVPVKLLPAGSASGPVEPVGDHTPASIVFYAAGSAYDATKDDRYLDIQRTVQAINGGPDEPQYDQDGSLATIFYAAGDGYNASGDERWLDIQRLVDAIKSDPR